MKSATVLTLVFAMTAAAGLARADEKGTYTLPEVKIVGHRAWPAVVEVKRLEPKLTLGELRPAMAGRVGEAALRDPF
jgi:hypothetical protein